jgi:hypothetical protein
VPNPIGAERAGKHWESGRLQAKLASFEVTVTKNSAEVPAGDPIASREQLRKIAAFNPFASMVKKDSTNHATMKSNEQTEPTMRRGQQAEKINALTKAGAARFTLRSIIRSHKPSQATYTRCSEVYAQECNSLLSDHY